MGGWGEGGAARKEVGKGFNDSRLLWGSVFGVGRSENPFQRKPKQAAQRHNGSEAKKETARERERRIKGTLPTQNALLFHSLSLVFS